MFQRTFLPVLLLVFSCGSLLSADVVEDTNITLAGGDELGDFSLTVFQDAGGTDPTLIVFDVATSGTDLVFNFANTLVDEGSDWFTADFGQSFTAATILNDEFGFWGGVEPGTSNLILGNDIVVPIGTPFFLAVNTGSGFSADTISPNRQHFGWVQLQANSATDIVILDNAVSYSDGGILIGQNIVPEPGGGLLIALATLGFLRRRRCRSAV